MHGRFDPKGPARRLGVAIVEASWRLGVVIVKASWCRCKAAMSRRGKDNFLAPREHTLWPRDAGVAEQCICNCGQAHSMWGRRFNLIVNTSNEQGQYPMRNVGVWAELGSRRRGVAKS